MSVSKRLRYEVMRRDGHACRYCGAEAPEAKLTIDHVVPVALGGLDEPTNLVTACAGCNAGKTSSQPDAPLVGDVADDALRWSQAMNEAARVQAGRRDLREEYITTFDTAWKDWTYVESGDPIPRPSSWEQSIGNFHDAGLEYYVLDDAMRTAMQKQTRGEHGAFKYMCGICWSILTERQEMARNLVRGDEQ